jgi:hypothetical protein
MPAWSDHAAKLVGVSPSYIYDAKLLNAKAPELAAQVKAGFVTLSAAKRQLVRAHFDAPKLDAVAVVKEATARIAAFVSGLKNEASSIPASSWPEIAMACARGAYLLDQLAKEMGGGAKGSAYQKAVRMARLGPKQPHPSDMPD